MAIAIGLACGVGVLWTLDGALDRGSAPQTDLVVGQDDARDPAPQDVAALAGVWWKWKPGRSGDPLRFYYFHGDGTGLYRYGRVGHAYTHSFDYDVDGDRLHLRFRKTGQAHDVRFSVRPGQDGERDFLVLHDDPREPDATEYFRDNARPRPSAPAAELGPAPAGHMWIDLQRFATGGQGFYFYQFRPVGIDGRGVGWFHRGDFDDWSTESLSYRIVEPDGADPRLELHFELAGTTEVTGFAIAGEGNARRMTVADDPRDFGQRHVYRDAGKSFGSIEALDAAGVDPRIAPIVTLPY